MNDNGKSTFACSIKCKSCISIFCSPKTDTLCILTVGLMYNICDCRSTLSCRFHWKTVYSFSQMKNILESDEFCCQHLCLFKNGKAVQFWATLTPKSASSFPFVFK